MPRKPRPTKRGNKGKEIPNPKYAGPYADVPSAYGIRHNGNPEHVAFAIDFQAKDRAAKNPYGGLYTRTVEALVKEFHCSVSTAFKALAALRVIRVAVMVDKIPGYAADLIEQWQEIADEAQQAKDFGPAVAALREVAKVTGVYAPKKIEVEHTAGPTVQTQLRSILDVLSPQGRAGLELALAELEQARLSGRLVLAPPADDGAHGVEHMEQES
jgi:hypothetical protein